MTPMPGSVGSMVGAMLILIVPSFLVVSGLTILAYRKRNQTRED